MNAVDTPAALPASDARGARRRLSILWATGTGVAVVLAASAFAVASRAAGPLVVTGTGEVTLGNVLGFTILGGTVGAVLAHVAHRFARRPRLTFLAVVLIALAGYAVVPFTAAENLATAVWLNILHLVVAIPVVGALSRYFPARAAGMDA